MTTLIPIMEPIYSQKLRDAVQKNHPTSVYIGEFPTAEHSTLSGLLYYEPNPPLNYSNYFMIYYQFFNLTDDPSVYISSGAKAASRVRDGIITPDGSFIYSRNRHDYISHDGCIVDGGDSYFRVGGDLSGAKLVRFRIEKDKIKLVEKVESEIDNG